MIFLETAVLSGVKNLMIYTKFEGFSPRLGPRTRDILVVCLVK